MTTYQGQNFRGQTLLAATRSPEGTGWAFTKRVFNAEGNLLREERPDGSEVVNTYFGDVDPVTGKFVESAFDDANGAAVLTRGSLKSSSVTAAPSLPSPIYIDSGGTEHTYTTRTWTYEIEPVFQQTARVIRPDATEERYLYDYQQGEFRFAQRAERTHTTNAGHEAQLFHIPASLLSAAFLDDDIDGDGLASGLSSGLVLSTLQDNGTTVTVQLGGGAGFVGKRYTRAPTGLVIREADIQDPNDASYDLNVVDHLYYDGIAAAEAGGTAGTGRVGMLASSSLSDGTQTVTTTHQYDAWGAPSRTARAVNGVEIADSVVETLRSELGDTVEVQNMLGLQVRHFYDDRGDRERTEHDDQTSFNTDSVSVFATGGQGMPIGECVEITAGGCDGFQTWADAELAAWRLDNAHTPSASAFQFTLRLYDQEDRNIGTLGSEDARVELTRNDAGSITSRTVDATPPMTQTYTSEQRNRRSANNTDCEVINA